ncbi:MAG: hypothetical protein M3N98_11545, partial [Actinomycetota bacterium]|nr:hypothetical protein [Actinomycetota bacterium]
MSGRSSSRRGPGVAGLNWSRFLVQRAVFGLLCMVAVLWLGGGPPPLITTSSQLVSANASATASATAKVRPALGTLVSLALSPASTSVVAGGAQRYTALGTDGAGHSADVTATTSFAITPDGSCTGAVCTPTGPDMPPWSAVSAGAYHSVAIGTDGTLWAWGLNANGQVGDGTTTDRHAPVEIGGDTHWQSVAAGGSHTVAIKSDGTLWAWGYNFNGQLGDGTAADRHAPVQIGTDSRWKSVAAGYRHTVAIKTDGTLWAWGLNANGQVGDGSTTDRHAPVQIGTDTHWQSVSAGLGHTVAIKTGGTLWSWGLNANGQLGNGTINESHSPGMIGLVTDSWQSVAAGSSHTVAIKSGGTLWSWGYNFYGQLGDGTTVDQHAPEQITSDNRWGSLAAGFGHSVAVKTNGMLYAWGYNFSGQLGDGTVADRHVPKRIGADTHWGTQPGGLAAGYGHTVSVKPDHTLWVWGRNANGQLGDRTSTTKRNPELITTMPHTVTGTNGSVTGTATLTVTAAPAGPMARLVLSPATATVVGGTPQAYTAEGFDAAGHDLGDRTSNTTFTIAGRACPAAVCATTSGDSAQSPLAVTGIDTPSSARGTATLTVTPNIGPLDHLVLSPPSATVTSGTAQAYRAEGFDASNNDLGDKTKDTTFTITPDGSCTAANCSATIASIHTVHGTLGTATGTATLTVKPASGALTRLVLSPASASIVAGGSQAYTAEGFDAAGHDLGDETSATTFTIVPSDGTCTSACTATAAGAHTVTGTVVVDATHSATGSASLTVTKGSLDHLVLTPATMTVGANVAQAYGAEGFDLYGNDLGPQTASYSIAPDGTCIAASCSTTTADTAGSHHTVTGTAANGALDTAALTVTGGQLARLALSPGTASVAAGGSQTYASEGFDQYGNDLGDKTPVTFLTISPDGSCTPPTCTAKVADTGGSHHTVTGTDGTATGTAVLTVTSAPLDHLRLSPPSGTVAAGVASAPFTAIGVDSFGNDLVDMTASTTFTIAPNGSCTGRTCTATMADTGTGAHTVTGTVTGGTASGTATLTVTAGAVDHLVLAPAVTSIVAGQSQTYTAEGFDFFNNDLGPKTGSTTFTLGPNGSCSAASCTATMAETAGSHHTVTGNIGTARGTATMTVRAGPLDHLNLSPHAASIVTGHSQAYAAEGFDVYGNDLNAVTGATTFTISPSDGSCSGAVCTATTAGAHTVTGKDGTATGSETLTVTTGALDHLVVSPPTATIVAGGSQSYTAEGFDASGNDIGAQTGAVFTISPTDGGASSCTAASCTSTKADAAPWKMVAAGEFHTVAIKRDGTLWTWGSNATGQLGDGTNLSRSAPQQIGVATWRMVAAGAGHTLGVQTNGTLWAWGDNSDGQLGVATPTELDVPTQVGALTTWQSVAAGYYHSLALQNDGLLWAWGQSALGQLGDPTFSNTSIPERVGSDTWQSVTAGYGHTVGVKTDGTLWAWGYNVYGQLGDGSTTTRRSPVQIGGLGVTNWQAAGAGYGHTVAVRTDGTAWAWGLNATGQLGDGTTIDHHTPAQIGTDTHWRTVAAGAYHSAAVKSDGTLWAWGSNSTGQLGDGTTTNRTSPQQIGTDTRWATVSGGYGHTGSLKVTGALWTWGSNSDGELGDGTTVNQRSPEAIGATTHHVVTAAIGSITGTASLTVLPGPLAGLTMAPTGTTVAANVPQPYAAEGFDAFNNDLGDKSSVTRFTILPDGTCSAAACRSKVADIGASTHTVTAAIGGVSTTSVLTVVPGPLDHMTLAPLDAIGVAGVDMAYGVTGFDAYNNRLVTMPATTLSIALNGTCTAVTCQATVADTAGSHHTVTVTAGSVTAATTLTVNPGPLASMVLSPSPANATIAANVAQSYTAFGFDAFGNALPDQLTIPSPATLSIARSGGSPVPCPPGPSCRDIVADTGGTHHTVTVTRGSVSASASLVVVPGPLDHLRLAPANATVAAGVSQAYTAEAFDFWSNDIGDRTGASTFTIAGGTCSGSSCQSTASGVGGVDHLVTATLGTPSGTTNLHVNPGPLAGLVLSPASSTITAGGSLAFTAEGRDAYNNSRGDATSGTTFSISPDGSCTAGSCTATKAEVGGSHHTVTGTNGLVTGSTPLTVGNATLDHLVVSPATATVAAGTAQSYTALGFDQYNNSVALTGVTVTYALTPDGTPCPGASCHSDVADTAFTHHTVTATASVGAATGTASLVVVPGPLDHLTLSPATATVAAGVSQAYTATAFDA